MKCQCESSLCDHLPNPCTRPVSGYVKMLYVEDTCNTCAANMCKSGGENYILTTEEWDAKRTKEM